MPILATGNSELWGAQRTYFALLPGHGRQTGMSSGHIAGPKPTEKTSRNAGRARLLGLHFFTVANASYVDGVPWLEEGSLGAVVVCTGI